MEPLKVMLQWLDRADLERVKPLLQRDNWQIVWQHPSEPILHVFLPPYIAEPLQKGDRNWQEFAVQAFTWYGVINYSVLVLANPVVFNLDLSLCK